MIALKDPTLQSLKWGALFLAAAYLINDALGRPIWILTLLLDMERENTFQTWFSSLLWLLCFQAGWEISQNQNSSFRQQSWRAISILFLLFSIDETAMLHERLTRTIHHLFFSRVEIQDSWPIFLSPVLLALGAGMVWAGRHLLDLNYGPHQTLLKGLGLFLFAAAGLELLDFLWNFPLYQSFRVLILCLEETCEMWGTILILQGLRQDLAAARVIVDFPKETAVPQEVSR